MQDENGIEVVSLAGKHLSPKPEPEDLTRVRTGPEETDYQYVDPASLFAAERLVQHMRGVGDGSKFVAAQARGWKKFVRDLVKAGYEYWPAGGYVRRGETLVDVLAGGAGGGADEGVVVPESATVEGAVAADAEVDGEEDSDAAYPEVDEEAAVLPPGLPGLGS